MLTLVFFVFALACCSYFPFLLSVLACRSGLPFWLAVLACRSGIFIVMSWHPCRFYSSRPWDSPFGRAPNPGACEKSIQSIFSKPVPGSTSHFLKGAKTNEKRLSHTNLPCGSLRDFKNHLINRHAQMRTSCALRSARHPWRSDLSLI